MDLELTPTFRRVTTRLAAHRLCVLCVAWGTSTFFNEARGGELEVQSAKIFSPGSFNLNRGALAVTVAAACSSRAPACRACMRACRRVYLPSSWTPCFTGIYGEPVRNQVPDASQMRLRRGAAFAECGWSVRAAAEGVRQYGSAGLGAEHFRSTGVSSGEVRSAGFRSGLQGRRGDANRRMAATFDDGPPQARARSPGGPIH
jgi:hypothetical protein